jgi:hypothetical protein
MGVSRRHRARSSILNADKRIGTHMFVTVARNDAGDGIKI